MQVLYSNMRKPAVLSDSGSSFKLAYALADLAIGDFFAFLRSCHQIQIGPAMQSDE